MSRIPRHIRLQAAAREARDIYDTGLIGWFKQNWRDTAVRWRVPLDPVLNEVEYRLDQEGLWNL